MNNELDSGEVRGTSGALTGRPRVNARFIPDVPVVTHRGEALDFYSDLVKDKIVLLHFMSVANHARYPVIPNLRRLQQLLASRDGGDFRLISITADPTRDTPERLAAFARRQGVYLDSWHFVTAAPDDTEALKLALYIHRGPDPKPAGVNRQEFIEFARSQLGGFRPEMFCGQPGDAGRDCSMGLMRYGNEAACLWGSCPARAEPEQIAERLNWIDPSTRPSRRRQLARGGPNLSA